MKEENLKRLTDTIVELVYKRIFSNICKRCGRLKDTEGELCAICKAKESDNMDFQREKQVSSLKVSIDNLKRDIDYKQGQIKNDEIKETRIVKIASNGEPTIIDGYLDNIKPSHLLLNEIEELSNNIEMYKRQIKLIEKAKQEDETTNTNGTEGKANT